uniref:Secreted protein n=1 Tax=Noccaea caerulescens TaxID=107243 RepID=A0A1J3DHJ4_NOCCA
MIIALTRMKLVVLISFLLLSPLCSSGFEEDHALTYTEQHSSDEIQESTEELMDYPPVGPNVPGGPRFRPPHA